MNENKEVSQVEIVTGILHMLHKKGVEKVDQELANVVFKAATDIANECKRKRVYADGEPMASAQWLASDDVGASSKFMHLVMTRECKPQLGDLPLDCSDFGRCVRMVRVCCLRDQVDLMRGCGDGWAAIADNWDSFVDLYDKKDKASLTALRGALDKINTY